MVSSDIDTLFNLQLNIFKLLLIIGIIDLLFVDTFIFPSSNIVRLFHQHIIIDHFAIELTRNIIIHIFLGVLSQSVIQQQPCQMFEPILYIFHLIFLKYFIAQFLQPVECILTVHRHIS